MKDYNSPTIEITVFTENAITASEQISPQNNGIGETDVVIGRW